VSDFGLVKAADNVLKTASGVSIGKISYMAPEQGQSGVAIDARADIFSLGVMLWEMLTLRSLIPPDDPARAATLMQTGAWEPPSRFNPRVPERLDRIVMSCLMIDREQRMPTAQQLSLELRELLHEMAAGYGRQQLARLVAWLFPEKGWNIAEPDQPAAQPSTEERLSMPMITPAAVAIQRAQDHSSMPPAPRPAPMPSAPGASRARRVAIVILSIALVILGVVAVVAIGAAIYFWRFAQPPPTTIAPRPTTAQPMMPATTVQDLSVSITTPVAGAHLYMGARDLGPMPITLRQHEMTGEPITAVAPQHEPRVIRAELILELMRTQPAYVIELMETDAPDIAAYVRYRGQGIAHLPSGEDLGPVPGVVLIPVHEGEPRQTSIVVWDETGVETEPLSLAGCADDHVCLLTVLPSSP
jgi:hypothetical protein